MRVADKVAAWLVCLLGVTHLLVGHAAFIAPNERRIWFASAGFLLIVTGLANLGAQAGGTRMQALAAAVGGLSILVIGGLFAWSNPDSLAQPQTLMLLALGVILTGNRLRQLAMRSRA